VSLEWRGDLAGNLRDIQAKTQRLDDDVAVGARVILTDSDERVPKRSGGLEKTGHVKRDRGGLNTVAIVYTSVYARWVHEHLHFKHPFGGEAKFLETAMLVKGHDALNAAGAHLWRRIT
jgi:hypothetical protein